MDKKKIIIGASALVGLVAIIWVIKNRKKVVKAIKNQGNGEITPAKKVAIDGLEKVIYDSKKNFCDTHTSTFYSATCSPSAINQTTYLRMQAMDGDLKKATVEEIKLFTKYLEPVMSGNSNATILSQPNLPYSDYEKLMVMKDKYPSWDIS
jgi:hypothetical protein